MMQGQVNVKCKPILLENVMKYHLGDTASISKNKLWKMDVSM